MFDPHALPAEDPQAQMFRAEWARRKKRNRVAGWILMGWTVLIVLFVITLATGLVEVPSGYGMMIFPVYFLPLLFYVLFGMVINRCPRCATNQSRLRNPRFCFNCGLRLLDE